MSKSVFLIDIDGVACEHAKAVCRYVQRTYGLSCDVDDVASWNHDFGPVSFVEVVEICYQDPGFILSMEVTPGFKRFLGRLVSRAEVVFVTARGECCHHSTRDWIIRHFGNFRVEFRHRKMEVDATYLLDDNAEEVTAFAKAGGRGMLFPRPWSRADVPTLATQPGCYVIQSFEDALRLLG